MGACVSTCTCVCMLRVLTDRGVRTSVSSESGAGNADPNPRLWALALVAATA